MADIDGTMLEIRALKKAIDMAIDAVWESSSILSNGDGMLELRAIEKAMVKAVEPMQQRMKAIVDNKKEEVFPMAKATEEALLMKNATEAVLEVAKAREEVLEMLKWIEEQRIEIEAMDEKLATEEKTRETIEREVVKRLAGGIGVRDLRAFQEVRMKVDL